MNEKVNITIIPDIIHMRLFKHQELLLIKSQHSSNLFTRLSPVADSVYD